MSSPNSKSAFFKLSSLTFFMIYTTLPNTVVSFSTVKLLLQKKGNSGRLTYFLSRTPHNCMNADVVLDLFSARDGHSTLILRLRQHGHRSW
jgi:hypothetical protein